MQLCRNARAHADYAAKLQRVTSYVNSFANKTVQGGTAWKFMRASNMVDGKLIVTVGGSEMPSVIGRNKYKPVEELIVEKVEFFTTGKPPARENMDMILRTEWGHICEPYSRIFICNMFDCDFFEIQESIVHGTDKRVRYSPDGVGVIRVNGGRNGDSAMIALLELKNPYDRIANKNVIPDYYDPQVCTGMDVIDMTEIGVYAECNFRCQSLTNFGRPVYNPRIHYKSSINGKKGAERFKDLEVYGSVLAFFYVPAAMKDSPGIRETNILAGACHEYIKNDLIDFGATDESLLNLLMAQVFKGHVKHYSFDRVDHIEDDSDRDAIIEGDSEEFRQWCEANGATPYGVLPLSLFAYSIMLRSKHTNFVEHQRAHIDSYTKRVHDAVDRAGGFHEAFYKFHALPSEDGNKSDPYGSAHPRSSDNPTEPLRDPVATSATDYDADGEQ